MMLGAAVALRPRRPVRRLVRVRCFIDWILWAKLRCVTTGVIHISAMGIEIEYCQD